MPLPRSRASDRAAIRNRSDWAHGQHRQVRAPRADHLMPVLGRASGRCWCGEKAGHDWPGRDSGDPHPRRAKESTPPPDRG